MVRHRDTCSDPKCAIMYAPSCECRISCCLGATVYIDHDFQKDSTFKLQNLDIKKKGMILNGLLKIKKMII